MVLGMGTNLRRLSIPLALFLIGCPIEYPPPAGPTEIRVVTYNTHHFGKHDAGHPDGADGPAMLADIQQMNWGLGTDIWLFQEGYRSLSPNVNPFPTDPLARIQEKLPGYDGFFAPYVTAEGKFAKGTAILWNTAKFEAVGPSMTLVFQATGSDSAKGGIGRILRRLSDSKEFLAVCLHLAAGIVTGPRTKQAKEAAQFFSQSVAQNAALLSVPPSQLPWILGGDLNTVWRTAEGAYQYLVNKEGMVASLGSTILTHKSGLHLDHILTRGMIVIGGDVRREATHSDHYPVFARLDLP